jgi:hypothetical protein
VHRTAGLSVRETRCPAVNNAATSGNEHDGPHDAPLVQCPLDGPVKPSTEPKVVHARVNAACLPEAAHARNAAPLRAASAPIDSSFHAARSDQKHSSVQLTALNLEP